MPTSKNGEIGYDFKAGVFSQALARAFEYNDKEILLNCWKKYIEVILPVYLEMYSNY